MMVKMKKTTTTIILTADTKYNKKSKFVLPDRYPFSWKSFPFDREPWTIAFLSFLTVKVGRVLHVVGHIKRNWLYFRSKMFLLCVCVYVHFNSWCEGTCKWGSKLLIKVSMGLTFQCDCDLLSNMLAFILFVHLVHPTQYFCPELKYIHTHTHTHIYRILHIN